jgi:hypothetical protein
MHLLQKKTQPAEFDTLDNALARKASLPDELNKQLDGHFDQSYYESKSGRLFGKCCFKECAGNATRLGKFSISRVLSKKHVSVFLAPVCVDCHEEESREDFRKTNVNAKFIRVEI